MDSSFQSKTNNIPSIKLEREDNHKFVKHDSINITGTNAGAVASAGISEYYYGAPGGARDTSMEEDNSKKSKKKRHARELDLMSFLKRPVVAPPIPSAWLAPAHISHTENTTDPTITKNSTVSGSSLYKDIRSDLSFTQTSVYDHSRGVPSSSGGVLETSGVNYEYNSNPKTYTSEYFNPTGTNIPICSFYLEGRCKYGDVCRYKHQDIESNRFNADDDEEEDLETCFVLAERAASKAIECGICLEKTFIIGKRFGILNGCDHPFCLSCIRNWRSSDEAVASSSVRACPICRVESFFIIPSERFIVEPERKMKLILNYKNEMQNIPCKHFDYGRGECAFGTSCFYSHLNEDGKVLNSTTSNARQVITQKGMKASVEEATLLDFMSLSI